MALTNATAIRSIPGMPTNAPLPSSGSVPFGYSSKSTIATSPELEKPRVNPFYLSHPVLMKTEQQAGRIAEQSQIECNNVDANRIQIKLQMDQALEEEARNVAQRTTWSVLASVAQYIASVSTIVLGVSALPVAPVAGGLLIASGGLGLVNRILHDTPLMDMCLSWWTKSQELQRKIAHDIEMGFFFLQMGLGLVGGVWALGSGALNAAVNSRNLIASTSSILAVGSNLMAKGANVGVAYYNRKISNVQADITKLTQAQRTDDQTIDQIARQNSDNLDHLRHAQASHKKLAHDCQGKA